MMLFALMIACAKPGPAEIDAQQYVIAVDPLLLENGLVAQRLLAEASDVYDGKAQGKDVKAAWIDDIAPLTEHLRDQASALSPPPSWNDSHKGLVDIWTIRADGYRDIAEAVVIGDPEMFKLGRDKADTAKLREETWFRDANARLQPYGLYLDQFP